MSLPSPQMTFACELETGPLQALFDRPEVKTFLQDTGSCVSLGLLDLSDQRAEVVRCLNNAGIPVTAWLLLPKDQGYWFNLDNYPQAVARYAQFKAWTEQHGLKWACVGLDIEPDMRALQLLSQYRVRAVLKLLQSAFNTLRLVHGTRAYHDLVAQIHADGYPVETYQFPFMVDERMAKSRFLQRLMGLVDLPEADREVLMLYSSFMRPWGQGLLWSYAPQAQGIGIGSTGGGVDLAGSLDVRPLNWPELQTDLLLARRHSENLFIFSLEGCVQQGLLPQLKDINWQQVVATPAAEAVRADNVRKVLRRGLWLSAKPAWLLFALALLLSAVTLIQRRRR